MAGMQARHRRIIRACLTVIANYNLCSNREMILAAVQESVAALPTLLMTNAHPPRPIAADNTRIF